MTLSPAEVIAQLPATFEKATHAGELFFFGSNVLTLPDLGTDILVRLCPALQKKASLPAPFTEQTHKVAAHEKVADPFMPPYSDLFVGEMSSPDQDYVILLNKYAIVQNHFLLITKDFKSQSSPLTPSDLLVSYSLLTAAKDAGHPMFAFYNCGDLSGASQPHKHLQFVPILDRDGPPVERIARSAMIESSRKPFSLPSLPYANHIFRFPTNLASMSEEDREEVLHRAFISLLDLTISSIRHDPTYPSKTPSFNVILTLEHLHLIPRAKESFTFPGTKESLSVNSLGFAGMLLVKSLEQFEAVKKSGVGQVLRGVSVESVHQIQYNRCNILVHL